jgi:rhodanese-related sulfurtransferase
MKNLRLCLVALFMVVFANMIAQGEEKPVVPDKLANAIVISAEEVENLIKSKAKVFDVRNELEYEAGHIPGAINIPYKEKSQKSVDFDSSLDKFDTKKLSVDKDTQIIIYCNGETCWKSFKASTALVKAGYKKVAWFRGGMPEWERKRFPVEK